MVDDCSEIDRPTLNEDPHPTTERIFKHERCVDGRFEPSLPVRIVRRRPVRDRDIRREAGVADHVDGARFILTIGRVKCLSLGDGDTECFRQNVRIHTADQTSAKHHIVAGILRCQPIGGPQSSLRLANRHAGRLR